MRIGWIGAGIMGKPMIRHLHHNGHQVHVYARHLEKIQDLKTDGIFLHPDIPALVQHVDVVCTMVGFPQDVQEVYEQLFKVLRPGMTCIDFTTSAPELAIKLYETGIQNQIQILDAPVTGGDIGAQNGTLTILVGGQKSVFEEMMPIFSAFGQEIHYCGKAGSGQKVKIANQIMIANTLQGICEAFSYCKGQGLDPGLVIECLQHGAAGSRQLSLLGEKMIQKDYAPGFYIKHFVKDLKIALHQDQVKLAGVEHVIQEYLDLIDQGYGEKGTQALIQAFQSNH